MKFLRRIGVAGTSLGALISVVWAAYFVKEAALAYSHPLYHRIWTFALGQAVLATFFLVLNLLGMWLVLRGTSPSRLSLRPPK